LSSFNRRFAENFVDGFFDPFAALKQMSKNFEKES
jgi:hypothetical protein